MSKAEQKQLPDAVRQTILASGCGLAIENTMIYHTPEVTKSG